MEKIFRHVEVVPSSVNRMVRLAGKMAAIRQFLSKFLLLSMFLLPGSIVSQLIKDLTTSTNQLSCSNLRVGGAHLMALFLVLAEDSSASCLSARGSSTRLKMVVGDG